MSTPELPLVRPASPRCIDELRRRLGDDAVTVDVSARATASRDYAWLSPVLMAAIPDDAVADVVVKLRTADEVAAVLTVAYEHDVAVVARGKGSGNYAQGVPLVHGMVIDMTALDGVIDVGDGWIEAAAGATFTRMEAAARTTGQELAMFPSTTSSALAGFLAGGAGGTGSIENGFLWDGFVQELSLLPCWDAPEIQTLTGDSATTHLHAYGTTGVFTSARVGLVPARRWTALFSSFPSIEAAGAAGWGILACDPKPRNLSIDDVALVAVLPAHHAMPPGRVSLRAILADSVVNAAKRAVVAADGVVEAVIDEATSLCVSLSYNHVTLRAKRLNPAICHVQIAGDATVSRYDEVRAAMPDALIHIDAYSLHGTLMYGGLYMSSFVDEDTLNAGMQRLGELGVDVTNPHTWMLGGHGPLDATVDAATANDPKRLLNPGKLPR